MIVRPCDGNETAEAWQLAISRKKGPVGLVLSRQGLPVLDRPNDKENRVALGAYIISEAKDNAPEARSEEHTSELQSRVNLVCRLLLEKKKK